MASACFMTVVFSTLLVLCLATSELRLSRQDDVSRRSCPDRQWVCDDDETCCQMLDGDWGCCHLPNAVCCPDGRTCCPHDHRCNVKSGRCEPAINMTAVAAAKSQPITGKDNVGLVCPNQSQCPTPGAACCRQYTGRYGCCIYPTNVCCDDGLHCCHVGTVCDQLHLVCVPYPSSPALSLKPANKAAYYAP